MVLLVGSMAIDVARPLTALETVCVWPLGSGDGPSGDHAAVATGATGASSTGAPAAAVPGATPLGLACTSCWCCWADSFLIPATRRLPWPPTNGSPARALK